MPLALTLPPGTYNVTDTRPLTQNALNAHLETAAGAHLHPADDPRWGEGGTLFGPSRTITATAFHALTGWRPRVMDIAAHLTATAPGPRLSVPQVAR